jgi:hypothetical protein
MRLEAGQQVLSEDAAKSAESPITDHIIVLLDKVSQSLSGNGAQRRTSRNSQGAQRRNSRASRGKDVTPKAIPSPDVKERNTPVIEVPSKEVQEMNLRGKDVKGNGPQENDLRLKQLPRRKDVGGKSFFLRKVRQQREKQLRAAKWAKLKLGKTLPSTLAIFLLVALTVGVGGYQAYKAWPNLFISAEELASTTSTNIGGPTLISSRIESLRYYLEIDPSNGPTTQNPLRATGMAPLEGGAKFKFHFKPTDGGYLYVIALGENGLPQTYLTSQPMPLSGVTSNRSVAGSDFRFPDGEQWFTIQEDAENTPFIIIFSKTQLKTPAFLSSQAGRDLGAEEQQELMNLRKQYAANTPELVTMRSGNQPFISVQSPARAANEPIIFDVSIKRQ